MNDSIAVLNAGSSSLKFSLFVERGDALELAARGQAEGLYTAPRFVAKDGEGRMIGEKSWGEGVKLGHDGALDHLVAFLRTELADHRLVGVGHRVVHGGLEYAHPVRLDPSVLAALEKYVPLAPLHQPHNLAPIRVLLERSPELPQVACFDTAFHQRRAGGRAGVRAAEGDHRPRRAPVRLSRAVVRVHRKRAAAVRRARGARQDGRAAPRQRLQHVRDRRRRAASRARWASPRPTDCRWARAAATSIPA